MSTFKKLNVVFFAVAVLGVSCNEQHDPSGHHKQFRKERAIAHMVTPKLTAKGTIPGAGDVVKVDIGAKYKLFCTSCHGESGDGKGPAGGALAVKPRDFTDKKWQSNTDDMRILTVIAKGGTAVGLNAAMAPWGALLNEEELGLMVGYVRKFAK